MFERGPLRYTSLTAARIVMAVIVVTSAVSAAEDHLSGYDVGELEFKRLEIGDMVVYFHQRKIGEAVVEKDFISYQFDVPTGTLLRKRSHWRDGLPESIVPAVEREEAESMAVGDVRFSRLYLIASDSDVFPLDPRPDNPCWVVTSVENGMLLATIVDAMTGEFLGRGVPPPHTGFTLSGPWYFNPCSGAWNSWYQNAAYWFNTMGYSTEAIAWPSEAEVAGHIQSCSTAMFYELAHGGSFSFSGGCLGGQGPEGTYSTEIRDWIDDYPKMPFAFIGSCEGMCNTGQGSFSNEFRKGSMDGVVTIGYCRMSEPECSDAWSNSVDWQDAMFDYTSQGYTVKAAFDQAIADYPMCFDCMRFLGDESLAVVPPVPRNEEGVLLGASLLPDTGTIETVFSYYVEHHDEDGERPIAGYVNIDGNLQEMYEILPGTSQYRYEASLQGGTHTHYFYFEGRCGSTRLPDSGVYMGPIVLGANLICSLWVEPNTVFVGDEIHLWMHGENVGLASGDSVVPEVLPLGGGATVPIAGPEPPFADIVGGEGVYFQWTYAALDTPSTHWSGHLFGTDGTSGLPIESDAATSDSVVILPRMFIRGDGTGDQHVAMSDAIHLLEWLYVPGGEEPACMDAADANDDGGIGMSDVLFTVRFLYLPGAPEPPAPGPSTCGPDPTVDSLECENHPCMETKWGRTK